MMGRSYTPAGGQRYRRDEPSHEEIRADGERFGASVTLYGEMVGMTPTELLEHAVDLIGAYRSQVDALMQYVPRKHEQKVKALDEPRHDAEKAIAAVKILIENQQAVFAAPDYPEEKKNDG